MRVNSEGKLCAFCAFRREIMAVPIKASRLLWKLKVGDIITVMHN